MEDQRMARSAEVLAHINFRSLATAQKQATKAKRYFRILVASQPKLEIKNVSFWQLH